MGKELIKELIMEFFRNRPPDRLEIIFRETKILNLVSKVIPNVPNDNVHSG